MGFGFKYNFGYGNGVSVDRPLINYSWSSTYQSNNQMYSTNSGTGTDLQLYSGQGVKFNGVDQRLTLNKENIALGTATLAFRVRSSIMETSNNLGVLYYESRFGWVSFINGKIAVREDTTYNIYTFNYSFINDEAFDIFLSFNDASLSLYVNGVLEQTQTITPIPRFNVLNIGSGGNDGFWYMNGILSDMVVFNRVLTQTEITKYSTNPNGFFNDALIDDTCVLNMPLAEHNEYCVDYANYSEKNFIDDEFLQDSSKWYQQDNVTVGDGVSNDSPTTVTTRLTYGQPYPNITNPKYVVLEISENTSDGYVVITNNTTEYSSKITSIGEHIIPLWTNDSTVRLYWKDITNGFIKVSKFQIVEVINGIYRINPYTDSCRDEAKQLPYGSQNANFIHTDIGIPLRGDKSQFFECNGVNKADTNISIDASKDFTLRWAMNYDDGNTADKWYHGTSTAYIDNRIAFGKEVYKRVFFALGKSSLTYTGSHEPKCYSIVRYDASTKTATLSIGDSVTDLTERITTTNLNFANTESIKFGNIGSFSVLDALLYFSFDEELFDDAKELELFNTNKGLLT